MDSYMNRASGEPATFEKSAPLTMFEDELCRVWATARFKVAWKANALMYKRRKSCERLRVALTCGLTIIMSIQERFCNI